jgi:hypothetical protein
MKRQMPPQIAVVGVPIFALSLALAMLASKLTRTRKG